MATQKTESQLTTEFDIIRNETVDGLNTKVRVANAFDNLNVSKVEKATGKQLSTEDYTTTEKTKVSNVPSDTNAALALKADLVAGKVPSSQLPAYVDDVLEYANLAALPGTGTSGIIYVTIDTNFEYRWSGSAYIRLVASPGTTDEVTEGTTNKYWTNARTIASALTGYVTATLASALDATMSVLQALQTLEKRINDIISIISSNTTNIANNTSAISGKQATLVNGTNIKTINSTPILGSGDLIISSATRTYDDVAYAAATTITLDGDGNYKNITGVNGAQTIAYSTFTDGKITKFIINKLSASDIVFTLPANSVIISSTLEAVGSGLTLTLSGISGSIYHVSVENKKGNLEAFISKIAAENALATDRVLYVNNVAASASQIAGTQTMRSFTIPANTLGPNSILRFSVQRSCTNSANQKTFKITTALGVDISSFSLSTTAESFLVHEVRNRNSLSSQILTMFGNVTGYGGKSGGVTTTTINFGIDQTINFTISLATTTEFAAFESIVVELIN